MKGERFALLFVGPGDVSIRYVLHPGMPAAVHHLATASRVDALRVVVAAPAEARSVAVAAGPVSFRGSPVFKVPVFRRTVYFSCVAVATAHTLTGHGFPVALVAEASLSNFGLHRMFPPEDLGVGQFQTMALDASFGRRDLMTTGAGDSDGLDFRPVVERADCFIADVLDMAGPAIRTRLFVVVAFEAAIHGEGLLAFRFMRDARVAVGAVYPIVDKVFVLHPNFALSDDHAVEDIVMTAQAGVVRDTRPRQVVAFEKVGQQVLRPADISLDITKDAGLIMAFQATGILVNRFLPGTETLLETMTPHTGFWLGRADGQGEQ